MKKKVSKILIPVLILLPVIYLGYQAYRILYRPYVTQTAVEYTMADSVDAVGIAVRDETLIRYSGGGVLGFQVADGARVAAGTVVGEVYGDESQAIAQVQLEAVEEQIQMLKNSQDAATTTGVDVDILLKQSQNATFSLISVLDSGDYADIAKARNDLTLYTNRRQIATGESAGFDELLASLTAHRDELAARAAAPLASVTTPVTGYFISPADGFEETATRAAVDSMTAGQLKAFLESGAAAPAPDVVGKVEQDYKWRFYAVVPAKKGARFAAGQQVTIQFLYTSAENIPAEVLSVTEDTENDLLKVELLCSEVTADTVALRVQEAQIAFKSYTGLRIDKRALHIVDGVNGVYIRYGDMAQFKQVTPIYEDENYFLVPLKTGKGNEVSLYDEIIVEGKDLYDGKLLS